MVHEFDKQRGDGKSMKVEAIIQVGCVEGEIGRQWNPGENQH